MWKCNFLLSNIHDIHTNILYFNIVQYFSCKMNVLFHLET